MKFLADENFPRPALEALRKAGWDVFSIAEKCPGISDDEVIALCASGQRVLLTFDKDFGELVFRRGLSAASGVVLFRITPESPDDAAAVALALVDSQQDLAETFCVVTRDRIRVRRMGQSRMPGDQGTSAI
jgi:predicted nuclease of predicted toxin-antitoxin system